MAIFVTWQLRVTLDSIRNSCDVFDCVIYRCPPPLWPKKSLIGKFWIQWFFSFAFDWIEVSIYCHQLPYVAICCTKLPLVAGGIHSSRLSAVGLVCYFPPPGKISASVQLVTPCLWDEKALRYLPFSHFQESIDFYTSGKVFPNTSLPEAAVWDTFPARVVKIPKDLLREDLFSVIGLILRDFEQQGKVQKIKENN